MVVNKDEIEIARTQRQDILKRQQAIEKAEARIRFMQTGYKQAFEEELVLNEIEIILQELLQRKKLHFVERQIEVLTDEEMLHVKKAITRLRNEERIITERRTIKPSSAGIPIGQPAVIIGGKSKRKSKPKK